MVDCYITKMTFTISELSVRKLLAGNCIIYYDDVNFLPYPPNVTPPKTKFFNLFLGFLAKLAKYINPEIMEPILWHVKYVICDRNEELKNYI